MQDFSIPCATVARLSKLLKVKFPEMTEWFHSIRIDDGVAVVSNREAIIAEQIGGPSGVTHLALDPAIIAQCEKEAPFDSVLHINVNAMLRFTSVKSSLGWQFKGNGGVWSTQPNDFDRWRTLIPKKPATKPKGGMFWNAELIAAVAQCSPSGRVVFEEIIDTSQITIIRDVMFDTWFAMFDPSMSERVVPASLPDWIA